MKQPKRTWLGAGRETESSGDGVPAEVVLEPGPAWIYAVGGAACAVGSLVYLYIDDKSGMLGRASLFAGAGGFLMTLAAKFIYGESADRRNILRGALAAASYLLLLAGFIVGIMFYVGWFEGSGRLPWALSGALAALLGGSGLFYGFRYQQSPEGRSIGRLLGFKDAAGGGPDGHYDSKGVMNGVEVLFDVVQNPPGRNSPASFRLEILCRCSNSAGLGLTVRPSGLFKAPLGAIFASFFAGGAVDVPGWGFYEVHSDRPETVLRLLSGLKREKNVFNEGAGFLTMSLKGGNFRFVFSKKGYIDISYVRLALQDATELVSLLSR